MGGRGFPHNAVIEGEFVVTTVRQQSRTIWLPVVFTAIFVSLIAWIWITMSGNFWGRALFWAVILVVIGPWFSSGVRPFLRWYGTTYAFTNRRVMIRQGVFNPRHVDIQFVGINNAIINRHGLDGLFGSGTLLLGQGPNHRLERVAHADKMLKLVLQLTALNHHQIGADLPWLEENFRQFRSRSPSAVAGAVAADGPHPPAPAPAQLPVATPAQPPADPGQAPAQPLTGA
jgi:hypothetical protein